MKGGAKRRNARRVISLPLIAEYQLLSFGACIQFHGQLLAAVQSPLKKRAAEKNKTEGLFDIEMVAPWGSREGTCCVGQVAVKFMKAIERNICFVKESISSNVLYFF